MILSNGGGEVGNIMIYSPKSSSLSSPQYRVRSATLNVGLIPISDGNIMIFPWGFWCRFEVELRRKFVGVIRIRFGQPKASE